MTTIASAFIRPFTSFKRFSIQTVLSAFPISFVGFLFAWGYLYECLMTTLEGQEDLPEWIGILENLKNGFMSFVVMIAYLLPGIIITVLAYPGKNPFNSADNPIIWVLSLGALLLIAGGYLIASAITNAAVYQNWGSAFFIREIGPRAFSTRYFLVLLLALIFNLMVFGIMYGIGTLTILPGLVGKVIYILFGAILGAYTGIVTATLIGQSV